MTHILSTYKVSGHLLFLIKLGVLLVDTRSKVGRIASEGDIKVLQEGVAACKERLGGIGVSINTRLAVKDNDTIGKIGGHDEIVLNDEGSLLGVHDESLNHSRGNDTLLGVKISGRLVNQVDVGGNSEGKDNGDSLKFTTGQVLDFLINEVIKLEGLDDVGLELRRQESLLDLLEEELSYSALELGGDSLWLHADTHVGDGTLAIRLECTSQKTAESSLASTVLTHHDNDFGVGELARVNAELEVAQSLLHRWVLEGTGLINSKIVGTFSNSESQALVTESHVLGRNVTIKEDVDTFSDRVGQRHNTVDSGASVQNANVIGKVVENGQIVLDDDDVVVVTKERADDLGSTQTLLDIKVGRRLVEHVNIRLLNTNSTDSETLKLTTGKEVDVSVHDVIQLQDVGDFLRVT